MTRGILVLAAVAAVLTVGATLGSATTSEGRQLAGTDGPGFTIDLKDEDGEAVSALRPGTYWLMVNDLSNRHNFHLFGPGLDEVVTTVPFVGETTIKIHLEHGEYTFHCDPHVATMRGTFEVGGVGQTD
jgi:plastocyanin